MHTHGNIYVLFFFYVHGRWSLACLAHAHSFVGKQGLTLGFYEMFKSIEQVVKHEHVCVCVLLRCDLTSLVCCVGGKVGKVLNTRCRVLISMLGGVVCFRKRGMLSPDTNWCDCCPLPIHLFLLDPPLLFPSHILLCGVCVGRFLVSLLV